MVKDNKNLVRIVHLSDTHSLYPDYVPLGDILIHSGNFSIDGHPGEYVCFNEWLGKQPHIHKIVILGNHDIDYMRREEKVDPLVEAQRRLPNATILSSQQIKVEGLKIYGIQWYWYHDWDYNIKDNRFTREDEFAIPTDTDVLVTHGPPYGILDVRGSGSEKLLKEIEKAKPRVHLFGHIHESNGFCKKVWEDDKVTHFYNSSIVSENSKRIVNQPTVIELSNS